MMKMEIEEKNILKIENFKRNNYNKYISIIKSGKFKTYTRTN